ncbi:zinc transporter 77C [Haematobia irritans]|uniref:zinc transporter 77C n=1 Tax=Haematobia irritans TaxID=7368 RepID=UPI003F4F56C7
MPIKNFLSRFQPIPLYIVLFLSICYFSVQLILSHLTHALTLLMASYHMLCNILALAGSIITIKHNELHNSNEEKRYSEMELNKDNGPTTTAQPTRENVSKLAYIDGTITTTIVHVAEDEARLTEQKRREMKTRNTFGWARIEILTMLIVCITLASLSFSLLVEALQTLVHIDHQDSMHLPVHVMILGVVGLLLNGFTYILIGGYTLHQGNFLHINPMGKVVVESSNIMMESNGLSKSHISSDHQLKEDLKAELGKVHYHTRREGPAEFLRDVSSTIFVIVCAVIVHFAKDREHTAKFIDPVLSIFSCVLVVALSYPYMKEACMILLQTIPGSIDINNFERNLVTKFPQIVSYHDLHIWQLSSHSYIATIHIIFKSPKLYEKTIEDVRSHFQDHSIAHVTIQPEFQAIDNGTATSTECLMQCQNPDCADKVCCKDSLTDLREISVSPGGEVTNGKKLKKHHHHHGHGHGHSHGHSHKYKAHSHSKQGKLSKHKICESQIPPTTTTSTNVEPIPDSEQKLTQSATIEVQVPIDNVREVKAEIEVQNEVENTENSLEKVNTITAKTEGSVVSAPSKTSEMRTPTNCNANNETETSQITKC